MYRDQYGRIAFNETGLLWVVGILLVYTFVGGVILRLLKNHRGRITDEMVAAFWIVTIPVLGTIWLGEQAARLIEAGFEFFRTRWVALKSKRKHNKPESTETELPKARAREKQR